MQTIQPCHLGTGAVRRWSVRAIVPMSGLCMILSVLATTGWSDEAPGPGTPRSWPQAYSVVHDESVGVLTLSTPYYVIEQDLKQGGAITRIALTHGKAANLILQPLAARVRDEDGTVLTDLRDSAPAVSRQRDGLNEIVTVECVLKNEAGGASDYRLRTTLQYRWGYIKIRRELLCPAGSRVQEICPVSTVLAPSLSDYGYREGITETENAPSFAFGSNRWARLRLTDPADPDLRTQYVPRSMIFVDPGVEGLEWFVGSDLAPWEMQLTGRRGDGQCLLSRSANPSGLALSIAPLWSPGHAVPVPSGYAVDFYLAVPLREDHALGPWLHTTFNRNRGNWVSTEQIGRWAAQGIQTIHCHHDGDYYDDGLFWRDGAYPPYPDMDRYDKVLADCRAVGIRTATYFSNKELHPSTQEYQDHGQQWGRMNRAGDLQHNFYRPNAEFGAQMCLRSGWLEFLKSSIDRVLTHHPLDGVYYDWNVALYCENPRHEAHREEGAPAAGHWDIDELLELMEWTRSRVGRDGLIIIHNTTVPMFAMENFSDYVVATEWGYQKWTDRAPDLQDLPLETSLAGAVPRGVISYGVLDANAPRRLHRLFAIEAFVNGVTPWPASNETFALLPLLKPLGEFRDYRFADWRNQAVTLSDARCASAIYSRPGESYVLLANLEADARDVTCVVHPDRLPHPLARLTRATRLDLAATSPDRVAAREGATLDVQQLVADGVPITIPGDDIILLHLQ